MVLDLASRGAARGSFRQGGFRGFSIFWAGQSVSVLGSEISSFAVSIWVYQTTGSMALFGLTLLFAFLPGILVSPFAGAIIDRVDLRSLLILTDLGAAASKLVLLILLLTGRLELWHVFAAEAVASILLVFQSPAVGAMTTLLVPNKHLGRASGMLSSGEAAARTAAPLLAGFLIGPIGLAGIVLLDCVTMLIALGALAMVLVPPRAPVEGDPATQGGFGRADLTFGWNYISARRGLLALVGFGFLLNLSLGMMFTVITPTVLQLSDPAVLGTIMSAAGVAMLLSSAALGIWGGTRRRIHGFFAAGTALGLAFLIAGASSGLVALAAGFILLHLALPLLNGSTQPIWQSKTPVAFQGRVFSIRVMLGRASLPIAYLLAPVLVAWGDRLIAGGRLPATPLLPQGGFDLLLFVMGAALLTALLACYRSPHVRRIEDLLPDCSNEPLPAQEDTVGAPAGEPKLVGA
jgi:MFS transporter, DHA3 family, macrolide efflux protein